MVTVLFFASIRERLGVERIKVSLTTSDASLDEFIAQLLAGKEPEWSEVLLADNVVRAVNQEVVKDNCPINDGDEVAFFPPVTGG